MTLLGPPGGLRRDFSASEFAIVVGIAFGYLILQSLAELFRTSELGHFGSRELFDEAHIAGVIRYELAVMPMILLVLLRNGWRRADFPLGPLGRGTAEGIGLALAGLAAVTLTHLLARALFGADHPALGELPHPQPGHEPSALLFAAACIVNPIFEEVLVVGYVVTALAGRFGTSTAIHASTLLRMLYHVYQGPFAFLWSGLYGLIAAHFFARARRLWPLIAGHALLDVIGLVFHYGVLPP